MDKSTLDELKKSYDELGSVWKVGKKHSISGQHVYSLLQKNGLIKKQNYLTEEDKSKIFEFYQDGINFTTLKSFADKINRTPQFISRFAKKHGLTNKNRKKDISVKKSFTNKSCVICGSEFIGLTYVASRKTCSNKCRAKLKSNNHKEWHKSTDHPKGMLGKTQSENVRKNMSRRMKVAWKDKDSVFNSKTFKEKQSERMSHQMIDRINKSPDSIYSRTKKGWVEFEGEKRYYFRSGWEMNYSMYLQFLKKHKNIKDWEYEVDTFWFKDIKRGVRSYTPDFKIFNNDNTIEYHEVKGWMDKKSKTKLNRMRIYYPDIKIELIDEKKYNQLKKNSKLLGFIT